MTSKGQFGRSFTTVISESLQTVFMRSFLIIVGSCLLLNAAVIDPSETEPVYAKVKLADVARWSGKHGESCQLPRMVKIDITADDITMTINALKSTRVIQYVPAYVIDDQKNAESPIRRIAHRENETYGLYHDIDKAAAIMITCPREGESQPLVEGTIYYNGRPHHLRMSSWRRHSTRLELTEPEYHLLPVPLRLSQGHRFNDVKPNRLSQDDRSEDIGLPNRQRRQFSHNNIIIDVIAIIAYDVYNDFYRVSSKQSPSEKEADALSSLKKHFALAMSETDLVYQMIKTLPYTISIRLAGYLIAQTPTASPWTELLKVNRGTGHRAVLDKDKALQNLQTWVRNSRTLRSMDYYVLFTNYDLSEISTKGTDSSTLGVSYVGGVCSIGKNMAVIESTDFAQSIFTTAHELGHGLGAEHDGEGNECHSSDNYIMGSDVLEVTPANIGHFGRFSNCSLRYFRTTFSRLAISHSQCLYEAATPIDVPSMAGVVPGQFYDLDAQCKQFQGNGSFMCTSIMTSGAQVCTELYCRVPTTSDRCEASIALRGTSCGDQKWCFNAQCVSSGEAPSLDESCPFGDRRDPPYSNNGALCPELINADRTRCYDSQIAKGCCQSCAKFYQNVTGCEYGDKATNCRASQCPFYSYADSQRLCCRTCGHHTAAPTIHHVTIPRLTTPHVTVAHVTSRPVTDHPTTPHPPVSSLYPGLNATLSQQCAVLHGPNSTACTSQMFGQPLDRLCHGGLYCTLPNRHYLCGGGNALNGTPCGTHLYCENGACVNLSLSQIVG